MHLLSVDINIVQKYILPRSNLLIKAVLVFPNKSGMSSVYVIWIDSYVRDLNGVNTL